MQYCYLVTVISIFLVSKVVGCYLPTPGNERFYPHLTLVSGFWASPWPHLDPLKINENTSVFITFPYLETI